MLVSNLITSCRGSFGNSLPVFRDRGMICVHFTLPRPHIVGFHWACLMKTDPVKIQANMEKKILQDGIMEEKLTQIKVYNISTASLERGWMDFTTILRQDYSDYLVNCYKFLYGNKLYFQDLCMEGKHLWNKLLCTRLAQMERNIIALARDEVSSKEAIKEVNIKDLF
ncbi:uncharacterized protein LOC132608921 isoform X2 [Lycium barbarum]|uniref:uncharacterized protein LOC132608921 isoform X2 n=1 Tax=Lycium barbarum TaxID=112863 RepID=UPI00293F4D77|nr:uncharacterized protein LOC132608921 isoform X2 [Lycium barbarum]